MATHEASRGPLKSTVSAQKALQRSETETRELLGGTEEKSVSRQVWQNYVFTYLDLLIFDCLLPLVMSTSGLM